MSMTTLWKDFEDLDVCKDIFKDVKFYVSGDVKSNVLDLLRCCGAERMNYFSDYVTHLICGDEPEETDLSDANDLYEIPALSVKWIFMCVKLKKLCSTKPYIYDPNKLFSNLTFCFSDVGKDRLALWAIVTYNGGVVHLNLDKNCTHLVTTSTTSAKFAKAESLGPDRIVIVTPDWVTESVRNKCLVDGDLFHPSLIDWPKVIRHESTTAITGFEPEQSELDEKALQITAPDSTQALLDKLKQRMPWNQTTSDSVAPPNVVAPSYTNAKSDVNPNTSQSQRFSQQNQISLQKSAQAVPTSFPNTQPINFMQPNQVPRSIVHHTPQSTHDSQFSQSVSFSQANLTNSQKINRALEQLQQQHQRSNLQLNRHNQINPQGSFNPLQRNRVVQLNPLQNQENQMNQVRPHSQSNQLQLPTSTQPNLLQNQLGQGNLLQSNQIQRQLSQMEQQGSLNQMQISPNQLQQHISQMNKPTGNSALNQLTQQQLINRQLQNQQLLKNQQNQLTQQQINQNPLTQQSNQSEGPLGQQIGQNLQQQISQNPIDRVQSQLGQQQLVQQQIIKNQLGQQQISQNLVAQQISQNQMGQQLRERQLTQQLNPNQLGQQQINQNQLAQQKIAQNQLDQQNQLGQQPINQSMSQQSINPNHLSQQSINQNQLPQQPINANQLSSQQSITQNQLSQHSINQSQLSQQPINQNQLPQQPINQSQLSQQQQINQNQLNQQINLTQLNQQINQNQLNQQTRLNQLNPSQLSQQQIIQNQQMVQQQNLNQQQLIQNQLGQLNQQQSQSNQLNQQQAQLDQLSQQQSLNQLNPQQNQLVQLQQLNQQHNQHGQLHHQNQSNPIAQNQLELNQQRQISQQIANQSNQNLELNQQRQLIQQSQSQNSQLQQQNQANLELNQTQLNQQRQLNQHLLQSRQNQSQNPPNQLAQMNQPNPLGQQVSQPNQLGQQLNQSQIGLQQNKLIQNQFNQQIVGQSQLNQQFVSSPGNQQFSQGGPHFGQTQQPNFNLNQQGSQQQLIQGQQVGQQQLIKSQQQQQQQQIVSQQQLINQKLIGNQQQQLLINQQQNQLQFNQAGNQPNQVAQPNLPNQPAQQRIGPPHLWQQQSQIIRHQNVVQTPGGPRGQWPPNQPGVLQQRQFIQLDSQTHQQLQQMAPEQRTLFVAKLQRQRQILQSRMQQQQQRGGHILIRGGPVPSGLSPQQQMQWLQQQANKQGIVFQQNIQQPNSNVPLQTNVTQNIQHSPGLSPIQQSPAFTEQNPQLQLQRQQQLRIQQYQLQREQAQKAIIQPPAPVQQANVARPLSQPVDPSASVDPNVQPNPLVVNPKTKTALANMLSIRLQSGGSTMAENISEPSAAGTLRLMTAQHNAALNSTSRPQELLTLQQRRIINRPNADLIRPPPTPSVPPANAGEPPKIPYSPRSTVPLQHRPGTYYGHNPNLKLPPDLFLLGCVFVVVEVDRFLEESTPGWQKKVEKHGGEIEKQYCNRVTHVICETQRHGVVMQALRDFKRCITLYWLSDVMIRKQVLPPWIALHLPTMYWDTPPGAKHLISLSGFDGTERDRVKHMIKYIGATLTTYFSKHNTLLIASKAEGPKYLHSKKWGIPVANIQWLTDVMLGHFSALSQMEHIKYQQFTDPPNFSFDPIMVPNLMHAWKMPINISQESYEKVKRSASPVVIPQKIKKMKTEHLTDENDNEENTMSSATHRVLFSMVADVNELKKIVRQLGGSIAKSHNDCTHLVMSQLMRSNKLLHCICLGAHILPESWLRDSQKENKFLDESSYSLDTKDFNSEFKCDFNATLSTKNRNKLFEGKYFYMTPSIFPCRKVLAELVQSCGGIVERNRRSSAQIEATNINSPYSYIILTHENDLHLVADLLKNNKDKVRIVCNVELILSAILRQTFEVEPYAVKIL